MKIKTIVLFVSLCLAGISQGTAQESVSKLLAKAQTEAKKDGKNIFIKFEASWCGWCRKMTKDMKAKNTKKFFDDHFVTVAVVVKESKKNKKLMINRKNDWQNLGLIYNI